MIKTTKTIMLMFEIGSGERQAVDKEEQKEDELGDKNKVEDKQNSSSKNHGGQDGDGSGEDEDEDDEEQKEDQLGDKNEVEDDEEDKNQDQDGEGEDEDNEKQKEDQLGDKNAIRSTPVSVSRWMNMW